MAPPAPIGTPGLLADLPEVAPLPPEELPELLPLPLEEPPKPPLPANAADARLLPEDPEETLPPLLPDEPLLPEDPELPEEPELPDEPELPEEPEPPDEPLPPAGILLARDRASLGSSMAIVSARQVLTKSMKD
jgi:hypothetical protein